MQGHAGRARLVVHTDVLLRTLKCAGPHPHPPPTGRSGRSKAFPRGLSVVMFRSPVKDFVLRRERSLQKMQTINNEYRSDSTADQKVHEVA